MDVWGITLATLRRWYVCLPIVAVAVAMALLAGRSASPEYDATGTVMLTPPRVGSEIANPFINVQGASEALTVILNGPETEAQLDERGLVGTVIVTSGSRTSVMVMRSTARSQEDALSLIDAAIEIGGHELETRQEEAGIAKNSYIGMQVLAAPSITGVANDTAVRVQAVVLALGAVIGVTLAVLFDDIVGFIKKRRGQPSRPREKRGRRGKNREPAEDNAEALTGDEKDSSDESSDGLGNPVDEGQPQEDQPQTETEPTAAPEPSNESSVSHDSPAEDGDSGTDSPPAEAEGVSIEEDAPESGDSDTQGSDQPEGGGSVDTDESASDSASPASIEVNGRGSVAVSDYVGTSRPRRAQ